MLPHLYLSAFNKFYKKILLLFLILPFISISAEAQQGLRAEYYDGVNFDKLVAVKVATNIDQYWNQVPPVPGINPHECSIRWTGKLKPGKSGNYGFSARVDDGIRVWINNQLIIDQWELNDVGIFKSNIDLEANVEYDLRVEYFNALIEGEVRLLWKIPKEEKSWFEMIFGEDDTHIVIAPEYFFQPDELVQDLASLAFSETLLQTNDAPKPKPKISKAQKPEIVTKKEKDHLSIPSPEAPKPDLYETIVTAEEADRFIPQNIAFAKGKSLILDSSVPALNLFAQFMLDHPQLKVMIEGHTDPVGDPSKNLLLSKQRAFKVAHFLVEKGIDGKRIEAKGFGGSQPLVVPKKGEYYPANRRVVFILSGLEEY